MAIWPALLCVAVAAAAEYKLVQRWGEVAITPGYTTKYAASQGDLILLSTERGDAGRVFVASTSDLARPAVQIDGGFGMFVGPRLLAALTDAGQSDWRVFRADSGQECPAGVSGAYNLLTMTSSCAAVDASCYVSADPRRVLVEIGSTARPADGASYGLSSSADTVVAMSPHALLAYRKVDGRLKSAQLELGGEGTFYTTVLADNSILATQHTDDSVTVYLVRMHGSKLAVDAEWRLRRLERGTIVSAKASMLATTVAVVYSVQGADGERAFASFYEFRSPEPFVCNVPVGPAQSSDGRPLLRAGLTQTPTGATAVAVYSNDDRYVPVFVSEIVFL